MGCLWWLLEETTGMATNEEKRPLVTSLARSLGMMLVAWFATLTLSYAQSTISDAEWVPDRPTTLIVPSNPGGGWDQTARFLQRAIIQEDLLPVSLEVVNRGGGGGTIALAEVVEQFEGDAENLMVTGFGMVGSALMHQSKYSLDQVTPIARLTGEFQVIAVAQNSPYQTIEDLLADFQTDPRSISWAGGSAGGSDQIFIVQVAQALGISPSDVNYVAFTGGGEANAALMGEQVTAAITGYGEISSIAESGRVRLLAVSSPTRVVNDDLPTFVESGVDVTFQNWRGVVAPPGLSDAQQAYFIDVVTRARASSVWQDTLTRNNWQDSFLVGDEFASFMMSNRERTAQTLTAMGVGKSSDASAIGPQFFPRIVFLGLLVSGILIVAPTLRSRLAGEASERLDKGQDDGPNWRSFAIIAALALSYIVALGLVGFIIATPLYIFGVSQMIERGNYFRDGFVAVSMTGAIYVIFERLLSVNVP